MDIPCPLCDAYHEPSVANPSQGITQDVCKECGTNLVLVRMPVSSSGRTQTQETSSPAQRKRGRAEIPARGKGLRTVLIVLLCTFNYSLLGAAIFGLQDAIKSSEAYQVSQSFVRQSDEIKDAIGNVSGFGAFPSSRIRTNGKRSIAEFDMAVTGSAGSTVVHISLVKEHEALWHIVGAQYEDEQGGLHSLLTQEAR